MNERKGCEFVCSHGTDLGGCSKYFGEWGAEGFCENSRCTRISPSKADVENGFRFVSSVAESRRNLYQID